MDQQQQRAEGKTNTGNNPTAAPTASPPSTNSPQPSTPNPLSKNQQKKRARLEKALAAKRLKKSHAKQVRLLSAQHSGRDLQKERETQLANEQDGSGWSRREELWKQKLINVNTYTSFRVCFDCSFEEQMTWKERNSLGMQLRYVYSRNRKSSHPVVVDVCSLRKGGDTRGHLEKVVGFPDNWSGRAFNSYEEGMDVVYGLDGEVGQNEGDIGGSGHDAVNSDVHHATATAHQSSDDNKDNDVGAASQESKDEATNTNPNNNTKSFKRKLIYLTGDSPNTLSTLDNDTTYIIGGIVDRNRLKCAALDRATSLHIPTARLPLQEYCDFKGSTRVLTCNHVFEILLRYRELGGGDCWKEAILSVLPERKDVTEKEERVIDQDECHDVAASAAVDNDEAARDTVDKVG
jgi:Trm5-related predicted tRNA methylase